MQPGGLTPGSGWKHGGPRHPGPCHRQIPWPAGNAHDWMRAANGDECVLGSRLREERLGDAVRGKTKSRYAVVGPTGPVLSPVDHGIPPGILGRLAPWPMDRYMYALALSCSSNLDRAVAVLVSVGQALRAWSHQPRRPVDRNGACERSSAKVARGR